jgi:hypothetical protein
MLKFTYKGLFLTIKIAYEKIWIENSNGGNMLHYLLYTYTFLFLETLKSRFLVEFQSFIFGQILVVLGKFCCIGMADNKPRDHLKS